MHEHGYTHTHTAAESFLSKIEVPIEWGAINFAYKRLATDVNFFKIFKRCTHMLCVEEGC